MGLIPYPAVVPLEAVKRLVLDAVSSPSTRAMYGKALDDFFAWRAEQGTPPFTRAAVQAHRAVLESKGYAPSTINQRLAAVKKLAREAAANGWLEAETAAAIEQVAGVKQQGTGSPARRPRPSSIARTTPPSKASATARCWLCWSAAACAAARPCHSLSPTSSRATAAG